VLRQSVRQPSPLAKSWSIRVCSVTQRRVASLFQKCALGLSDRCGVTHAGSPVFPQAVMSDYNRLSFPVPTSG